MNASVYLPVLEEYLCVYVFLCVCMKENVFMVCFERSVRRAKRLCYDYLKYSSVIMNECRKERNALLFPLKYYLIKSIRNI